ncbi:alpha/beta hydrolase [Chitinophagaceae bacterium LB-8]|uniref:Alpha/beta hydrolase n=1 Tax=Paraflavisolibacter caeni TaxID=2982496 RepID=A0A9X2XMS5_9BACT|nr:alpha/beta hydrolase [Paraflavisolibacter caeni]MCU7547798.1 alpha/beta hydrolase [Paraflavisolibacter caeni]
MKFLVAWVLMIPVLVTAQSIPRDTSFTVYGTYIKESKGRPYIRVAQPAMPEGVKSKENIIYSTMGNRELSADVFYPAKKSKKGYPAVVMIFGGGWRSGDKSQNVPIAQQLAAKGYVAMTIEYRLSQEAQYPAAVQDVKAAIRWLRANAKQYNIDKSKIATLGMSAGGQLAALAGTTNGIAKFEGPGGNAKQSSDVEAIVNIDGTLAFHHPESVEGKAASEFLGGTYQEKPEVWEEAAPLNHTGKHTPPIIFINSSIPRFHAGRDDMIRILDKYGIYHEEHTLPDTPHPFWFFHPWFEPTVNYTVQFLDKVFKKK